MDTLLKTEYAERYRRTPPPPPELSCIISCTPEFRPMPLIRLKSLRAGWGEVPDGCQVEAETEHGGGGEYGGSGTL